MYEYFIVTYKKDLANGKYDFYDINFFVRSGNCLICGVHKKSK